MKPTILSSYAFGKHTINLDESISRLEDSAQYKDLSTIIIIPAFKDIPTKVVASWLNLIMPPNNKIARFFALGMEVGEAYSQTIDAIVNHPELRDWKYILTMEHDNVPPPDGLVTLLAKMESDEGQQYGAVGGLYFTKGEGGVPQIWGDPYDFPLNFRPQPPRQDQLVECCGTGMGFTLFRVSMFKDKKLSRPFFKTTSSIKEGIHSQDLYFWKNARKRGYRCAIDCSVKVGHYDSIADILW